MEWWGNKWQAGLQRQHLGCLDLMAKEEIGRGADLLAQRIKAIEKATAENHSNAAQFLELLPPENSTLLEKDEELYL